MKLRVRFVSVLLLVMVIVLGTAGAAYAGTITVKLKSDNFYNAPYGGIPMLLPHITPCTIHVYGPNWYRSATYGGWKGLATGTTVTAATFPNAPRGSYRVRVVWKAGFDSAAQEANQDFSLFWLAPNSTRTFQSP